MVEISDQSWRNELLLVFCSLSFSSRSLSPTLLAHGHVPNYSTRPYVSCRRRSPLWNPLLSPRTPRMADTTKTKTVEMADTTMRITTGGNVASYAAHALKFLEVGMGTALCEATHLPTYYLSSDSELTTDKPINHPNHTPRSLRPRPLRVLKRSTPSNPRDAPAHLRRREDQARARRKTVAVHRVWTPRAGWDRAAEFGARAWWSDKVSRLSTCNLTCNLTSLL